jgi:hypothetical protein
MRQDADAAAPGRVQLPAPRPLQDLGALVLGDDALDLQQQIVLRPLAQRAVQEHQLDAAMLQLVHEQRLVGIAPRQAVGRMHVQAIDGPRRGLVAQPLQGGAHQGAAAVALVEEAQFLVQRQPLLSHAPAQGLHLTVDRVLVRLPLRGHARVDGGAENAKICGLHQEPPGQSAR